MCGCRPAEHDRHHHDVDTGAPRRLPTDRNTPTPARAAVSSTARREHRRAGRDGPSHRVPSCHDPQRRARRGVAEEARLRGRVGRSQRRGVSRWHVTRRSSRVVTTPASTRSSRNEATSTSSCSGVTPRTFGSSSVESSAQVRSSSRSLPHERADRVERQHPHRALIEEHRVAVQLVTDHARCAAELGAAG